MQAPDIRHPWIKSGVCGVNAAESRTRVSPEYTSLRPFLHMMHLFAMPALSVQPAVAPHRLVVICIPIAFLVTRTVPLSLPVHFEALL